MHRDLQKEVLFREQRKEEQVRAKALVDDKGVVDERNVVEHARARKKIDYVSLSLSLFGDLVDEDEEAYNSRGASPVKVKAKSGNKNNREGNVKNKGNANKKGNAKEKAQKKRKRQGEEVKSEKVKRVRKMTEKAILSRENVCNYTTRKQER